MRSVLTCSFACILAATAAAGFLAVPAPDDP